MPRGSRCPGCSCCDAAFHHGLLTVLAPTFASAQRGPGARGGFANNPGIRLWTELDQRFDGFTEHLSLSEEQTGQVTALVDDFRDKNQNVLGRFHTMMAEMRSRMGGGAAGGARRRSGGGNRQGMQQTGQELRALVGQLAPAFKTLHTDISAVLDEEQVKSMTQLLERQRPGG